MKIKNLTIVGLKKEEHRSTQSGLNTCTCTLINTGIMEQIVYIHTCTCTFVCLHSSLIGYEVLKCSQEFAINRLTKSYSNLWIFLTSKPSNKLFH